MSLATRCPSCGTVFRVVSDQLKVSEGWVRCGRCSEVFNAEQRLFDLEQAGAPAVPAAQPQPQPQPQPAEHSAEAQAAVAASSPDPAAADSKPDAGAQADGAAEPAGPASAPEFIRRAERAARWSHPARRGTLAAVAALLVALLGAQIAMHYRDRFAAAWPAAQPSLQAACHVLGCRVEAPRRIDSLHVNSSGLVRLQESPWYRFSLVVQNSAPTAVRMPAVELAITDSQGQTMARRVLAAAELGEPADRLPPGGELTLQATLELGERSVAGYTVELFYP